MITKCFRVQILLGILLLVFVNKVSAQDGKISTEPETKVKTSKYKKFENYDSRSFKISIEKLFPHQLIESPPNKSLRSYSGIISPDRREKILQDAEQQYINGELKEHSLSETISALSQVNDSKSPSSKALLIEDLLKEINIIPEAESSNIIYISQHRMDDRLCFHIFNGSRGFLVDQSFNLYTGRDRWVNIPKYIEKRELTSELTEPSISAYLSFIENASKVRIPDDGIPTRDFAKTLTSKDSLSDQSEIIRFIRSIQLKTDKHATNELLQSTSIMAIERIENSNILYLKDREGKEIKRKIPPQQNISLDVKNDEILAMESDAISRLEIQRLFKNKTIFFTEKENMDRGIDNLAKLNTTQLRQQDIELINFLPKDKKQANNLGLEDWEAGDIKSLRKALQPIIKKYIPKSQILTNNMNRNRNFFGKIFGKEKNDFKEELLNSWGKSNKRKVKIMIFVARGSQDHIIMPTKEKLRIEDIDNLPHDAFENTLVFSFACKTGLEGDNNINMSNSFTDAFKKKGAIGIYAPDYEMDTSDLPNLLSLILEAISNGSNGKELIRIIDKEVKGFDDFEFPSPRVDIDSLPWKKLCLATNNIVQNTMGNMN